MPGFPPQVDRIRTMARIPGTPGRIVLPRPEDAAADSAVLRIPGIGGLRLLHCTHADRDPPVAARAPHRHDLWHCVAYAEGSGTCIHDGAVVPVAAPTLVLTSPGRLHSFARLPGEDAAYHEITFAAVRPGASAGWDALLSAWTGTACAPPGIAPCTAACAADVGAIAARMGAIVGAQRPHAPVLLQGLLAELLLAVFRHAVAEAERPAPVDGVEAARRFVEAHAEDPIDLGAVARAAGLSAKHLGRAFAARFGLPPMRYRRAVLMRRAAVLLRTSDEPVERVAARLGYDDWRYFSRCFAAEHGVPPGTYRRQGPADPAPPPPASAPAR